MNQISLRRHVPEPGELDPYADVAQRRRQPRGVVGHAIKATVGATLEHCHP
jgi:hypothetical protein